MNDKMKLFESHLREDEKAENTINKYLRYIKEFYNWFERQNTCRGEPTLVWGEPTLVWGESTPVGASTASPNRKCDKAPLGCEPES